VYNELEHAQRLLASLGRNRRGESSPVDPTIRCERGREGLRHRGDRSPAGRVQAVDACVGVCARGRVWLSAVQVPARLVNAKGRALMDLPDAGAEA
jgi:hypothetical protein